MAAHLHKAGKKPAKIQKKTPTQMPPVAAGRRDFRYKMAAADLVASLEF